MEGKGSQFAELTALPLSCADFIEILGASTSWNLTVWPADCFTYGPNLTVDQQLQ